MCGIIGSLSKLSPVISSLIDGLYELQNRGYDSMGVSLLEQDFEILKEVCLTEPDLLGFLKKKLGQRKALNGIAHSRWATHGGVSTRNAHPHLCYQGMFALVHNGIIENYKELKETLTKENVVFHSETDTEVVVNLISFYFTRLIPAHANILDSVTEAISAASKVLQGTFALVIQCRLFPDKLFCIRYGSPMLIGLSTDLVMVVSEKSAFVEGIDQYFALNNHDLVILHSNGLFSQYDTRSESYSLREINEKITETRLEERFRTWTEKEIFEQPEAIRRSINYGSRILPGFSGVQLGGLSRVRDRLLSVRHLVLAGCGTSYHSSLLCASYFRRLTHFLTVQVADGSEFEPDILSKSDTTCMVVVSQSGETIDLVKTIEKFRKAQPEGIVIGVINVVDSLISTLVDAGVYINCGREKGVASTKSFTTQVIVLFLISIFFSDRRLRRDEVSLLLQDLTALPTTLEKNIQSYFDLVQQDFAPYVSDFNNIFIVGKSSDYFIAMESSLKIKEISYIHSEAYSSSSLKHGPFALLDKDMLVILISSDEKERKKIENAYEEISARGSPILLISYQNINDCSRFIHINQHSFSYLEANCVLQILAHEISFQKNINPDFPRNLAKVVTVE